MSCTHYGTSARRALLKEADRTNVIVAVTDFGTDPPTIGMKRNMTDKIEIGNANMKDDNIETIFNAIGRNISS